MNDILSKYEVIFWDFDGVIKDSVSSKTFAYERLFDDSNSELALKIKTHHEKNGGVSRYEKIPLYLSWAGFVVTQSLVNFYCEKFSNTVMQLVIESPWVPGVREFLLEHCESKRFFLLTATPTEEIKLILRETSLDNIFEEVHGAPIKKDVVVQEIIAKQNIQLSSAVFVGDSISDYEAAKNNNLDFCLRVTPLNLKLQNIHKGISFRGLN
jgi:phosphoglycolate phosphatase-like HAD superfamily hydrolase